MSDPYRELPLGSRNDFVVNPDGVPWGDEVEMALIAPPRAVTNDVAVNRRHKSDDRPTDTSAHCVGPQAATRLHRLKIMPLSSPMPGTRRREICSVGSREICTL